MTRVSKIISLIKKLLRGAQAKSADSNYIIPRTLHNISKTDISINALKVLNALTRAGFEAYLVGGSVRDLLLHKAPKDFDVATNATPNQVRNLFRNARIIGRRFKLVHILYHREIIEVATFRRSHENEEQLEVHSDTGMILRDNAFGDLKDDVFRRDFTINALYYNITDSSIVDMTGGIRDIHDKVISLIGDVKTRYREDPVRMLRAVRFAAKLDFTISEEAAEPLPEHAHLLTHVAGSRLFDEIIKMHHCGNAKTCHQLLIEHKMFPWLFAATCQALDNPRWPAAEFLNIALENTDRRVQNDKPVMPAFLLCVLLWFPLRDRAEKLQQEHAMEPLEALEKAMSEVIAEQCRVITIPRRHAMVMREIWILQYRFPRRTGQRCFHILQHSRFRAAYDFLALRALAGDEDMELADWWTRFQDVPPEEQAEMVRALGSPDKAKRKRRRKPARNSE